MGVKQEPLNYIKLFLEDLVENTLRQTFLVPWCATRSESVKEAYKEIPDTYKINNSLFDALQTLKDIYTNDYKNFVNNVVNKFMYAAASDKPYLLRTAVEEMSLKLDMKENLGILAFLAVITGISIDMRIYTDDEFIPFLIDGAVSSIKRAGLGKTYELFIYINYSINTILRERPLEGLQRMNPLDCILPFGNQLRN